MAAAVLLEIEVRAKKMGNYQPILMQIGTQTKKNMLSSKLIIPEVTMKFQDIRHRHIGN
jgi:hypothetical protein